MQNEVSEELINKILEKGGNVQDSVKRLKDILKDDTLTTKDYPNSVIEVFLNLDNELESRFYKN